MEAKRAGCRDNVPKGAGRTTVKCRKNKRFFRRELASSKSLVKKRAGQIPLLPKGAAKNLNFPCVARKKTATFLVSRPIAPPLARCFPARQYGMHLDGKLTLQTRRRFTSTEPADVEQLRSKYTVLENMWLLGQLRQPGRAMFKDLARGTFESFLKILLNKRNFNYKKEVDGQLLTKPCWSHCLSYEYEIRKEAYKKMPHHVNGHRRSSQNNLRGQ